MMPQEPVRDIMRRTMQNLEFVEIHAGANGPYEVTQLINSFLGALAHPWEKYQDDLTATSLEAVQVAGWPVTAEERPTDRDPRSLAELSARGFVCLSVLSAGIEPGRKPLR